MPLAPRVHRSPDCDRSATNAKVTEIALALMGVGEVDHGVFSETASWDQTATPCVLGRDAITAHLLNKVPPQSISIDQVVCHGKAGTVSGRLTRDGIGTMVFCHVIRFTDLSCRQVGQAVSFEHRDAA